MLPTRDSNAPPGAQYGPAGVYLGPAAAISLQGGTPALGILRIAADVVDAQIVTIGADVYEFDRADNGVTAGRIAVTAHADDTPANATNALIAKINASGTENVKAIDFDANTILLVSTDIPGGGIIGPGSAIATTETLGGAGNAWDATTMVVGAAAGVSVMQERVPTAAEVTDGNASFIFPFTVGSAFAFVRITSTGITKVWIGGIVIAGNVVTVDNAGGTDWATTDTIIVIAAE